MFKLRVCLSIFVSHFAIIQCNKFVGKGLTAYDINVGRNETPLLCYVCNSEYDGIDCLDPFNNNTIEYIDCRNKIVPEHLLNSTSSSYIPPPIPVLCRKIKQIVAGKHRIIRECGWIPSDYDDKEKCAKRTGTKDVEMHYCSCSTSYCNAGSGIRAGFGVFACVVATTVLFNKILEW